MKLFGKCMTLLMVASMATAGMATVAVASEDIPPAGYNSPAVTQQETQSAPARPATLSRGDYQNEVDNNAVRKSNIENSPSLRYDGTVTGDVGNRSIPMEDAIADDAAMVSASTDSRIYDPEGTSGLSDAARENGITPLNETAVTTDETVINTAHPDTGRTAVALPLTAGALLVAAAVPFAGKKKKQ